MQDRWLDTIRLPDNFFKDAKRYRRYRGSFEHIRLWTLSPYDILISKIIRWKPKDIDDIKTLLEEKTLVREKLMKRINRMQIPQKQLFEKNYAAFSARFGSKLKEKSWI